MNPFDRWLPMYPPRSLITRPMWRVDGTISVIRTDGSGINIERMELKEITPAIDAFDLAHPVSAPPPMEGQVWHRHGVIQRVVDLGSSGDAWGVSFPGVTATCYSTKGLPGLLWPPSESVLLAGPTPWGLNVPWYPPNWRP